MIDPSPDPEMRDRSQDPASAPAASPLEDLRNLVLAAARELGARPAGTAGEGEGDGDRTGGARVGVGAGGGRGGVTLQRPPRADLGDYSTNAALLLAQSVGEPPRALAERLGHVLERELGADLRRFEVAGPGFLNLFLSDSWLEGALAAALAAGESFGGAGARVTEHILVEFVSANPTGPMHVGHARNAAYGDALARVLAFCGHSVEREFYVNDAGSQIRKLGESIQALARGEAVAQDGYKGDYVVELAAELAGASSMDPDELGRAAVAVMIGRLQASLAAFGVSFDHWQYESTLHQGAPSLVEHTLAILEAQGHTYSSEGALWLRTTDFGDDKDRVLVRSNGEHTYFASDIAYHQDKRERGFERQIDVWGADHHGYVRRMKAAYQALGGDPHELELLIMQLVHLVSAGERAQMSKRAGEFVTLDELAAEIGVDAARWYLLARSHDTTVDLDLDLAREQSSENPVYYVQYAHARIASILVKAGAERVRAALVAAGEDAGAQRERRDPLDATERALVQLLLAFPLELSEAAQRRAPHRIAAYALELAQGFTAFYRDCRVLGADEEAQADGRPVEVGGRSLEDWRIALCVASRRTIARCLALLGVSAPEEM
jgi:arginyl-tRNA synthetase